MQESREYISLLAKVNVTANCVRIVAPTNLPKEDFPMNELKSLYHLRWGIETSFRSLKYTVGLLHFHAKKAENILKEVFVRLTLYNFSSLIALHSTVPDSKRKSPCKVKFSAAVHLCRQFIPIAVQCGFCCKRILLIVQKILL